MPMFSDKKRIFWRALVESVLPVAAGLAWATFAWWQGKFLFDTFSAFGVGFFFTLALQGQLLRVAKNVRDDDDSNDFRANFATIHDALGDIKANVPQLSQKAPPKTSKQSSKPLAPVPPGAEHFRFEVVPRPYQNYFLQAGQAVRDGHNAAGALTAATAFEYAAREAARRKDLFVEKVPLGKLLRQISKTNQQYQSLMALNRLRNSLVHSENDLSSMSKDEALEVIKAFVEGLGLLD